MNRFYVICFDITDKKRLRQVSIQMENFGARVQYSVFECHLDANQLETLKSRLSGIIDPNDDHVRYYSLCSKDTPKILIDGPGVVTTNNDYHLM